MDGAVWSSCTRAHGARGLLLRGGLWAATGEGHVHGPAAEEEEEATNPGVLGAELGRAPVLSGSSSGERKTRVGQQVNMKARLLVSEKPRETVSR